MTKSCAETVLSCGDDGVAVTAAACGATVNITNLHVPEKVVTAAYETEKKQQYEHII